MWIGGKYDRSKYKFTDGSTYNLTITKTSRDDVCLRIAASNNPDGRGCGKASPYLCMAPALYMPGGEV